jgi:hypothetical protein
MAVSLAQVGLVVGIATPLISGSYYVIRAVWRFFRKFDQACTDIADFKMNHFPHIDYALREICKKMDIVYLDLGEGTWAHDEAFASGMAHRRRNGEKEGEKT